MPKPLLKDEDLKDLPWENGEGGVQENLDPKKLRTWVLGLMNDKIKAQNARDKVVEERDELKGQVSELEAAVDPSKVDETVKQLTKEKAALEKRLSEPSEREWRLEVALEKGLTVKQAERLRGGDKDALAEDADAYLEEIGAAKGNDDGADGHQNDGDRQPPPPGSKNGFQRDTEPLDGGDLPQVDWNAFV